jgi:iron complex outermembrane receptor protein
MQTKLFFNGEANLTIKLTEEANVLQEVVVQIGYGSVKRKIQVQ